MRELHILLLALTIILGTACNNSSEPSTSAVTETITPQEKLPLPDWAESAVIYEVNVRQYTPEGTFAAFEKHLPRLKKMGIDILWFMPMYPISKAKRKGGLGSYYAVSDYKAVNPEFGTMEDFDKLVAAIHAQGMKIILDWVPNHTGWDHPWISAHPDWYTQDSLGNIIDPIDPGTGESWGWTDVADLNYNNKDMWAEMISDKLFWIEQHDIDGFREDVAHQVPNAFWDEVVKALSKVSKPVFMLAEAEIAEQRNSGNFHMNYGWSAHHLLNHIAKGEKKADSLWTYLKKDKQFTKGFAMHFTSNHDENTWAGTVFDRMGPAHKTLAALTFSFDGMPLIYGGQEEPLKHRLLFFEKDDIGFKDFEYENFYSRLIEMKHNNKALWNGTAGGEIKQLTEHPDVFAFSRQKGNNIVTGIFNLSGERQSITLPSDIKGNEVLTDQSINWSSNTALGLEPWQYYLVTTD